MIAAAARRKPIQIPEDLRGVLTVDVATAAKHVGIGKSAYYEGVIAGAYPGRKFGRRTVVLVHELLEFLGITADDLEAA